MLKAGEVSMAAWRYGLLGPVEVRVDGRAIPPPGARQRLVLTMLLVDRNRVVPAGRPIDELWDAALPADPRGALRTQVSRLRRALGPAGGDLATVEGGYCLTVQRDQLDATRFEDTLAEAAQASSEQALTLIDEALALWRGPGPLVSRLILPPGRTHARAFPGIAGVAVSGHERSERRI
jgi:DNA-binding SARP family transcriptional activator